MANSDLGKLDIPSCAIPYNLNSTTGATKAGSYAVIFDLADSTSTSDN